MLVLFSGLFFFFKALLSGDTGPTKCPHRRCRDNEACAQNHAQNHSVYLYFFILSSEIAGSIISLITLLDMMHQNLSFTGIHWIEHKVSQWIHNWQFCPLHLQQWMTVSRYFVFLFSPFWLFLCFLLFLYSDHVVVFVHLSFCLQTSR